MGLFKTSAERKRERDLQVRKGLQAIRRNIRSLEKNLKDYRAKAVRAKQLEATEQLNMLRDVIRRSMAQMRLQERQLLAIETAVQMKNQAEVAEQFAASMVAVSRSISEAFGSVDMDATLANYEQAMARAEDMEQRMELFLDLTADVMSSEDAAGAELVSMEEIDRLIEQDVEAAEASRLDEKIDQALARSGVKS